MFSLSLAIQILFKKKYTSHKKIIQFKNNTKAQCLFLLWNRVGGGLLAFSMPGSMLSASLMPFNPAGHLPHFTDAETEVLKSNLLNDGTWI